MSRDVFRLALIGSRSAWGRPLGIVAGVAIGVALLLTLLGAASGLRARDQRTAWLNVNFSRSEGSNSLSDHEALVRPDVEFYDDLAIDRRDISTSESTQLLTSWGAKPPAAGTYLASPALIDLIQSVPQDQLGERFGTLAGEIPQAGLASPDTLVAMVGRPVEDLQGAGGGMLLTDLEGFENAANPVYRSIIIVGGIAMFLPVLLFVSIVTQLGSAQRSERFSALRLIGASPAIVVKLAAVEMAGLSTAGAVIGVAVWRLTRPIAASFSIDQGSFFDSDLTLSPSTIVLVAGGAVIAATIVAGWRMTRTGIGPLGVTRQQQERNPSFLRILPLVAGFGSIIWATTVWKNTVNSSLLEIALIGGFTLTAIGIVLVGPWLTSLISQLAMKRTQSAAGVIAASRIRQHPAATFRSVSGLVLAVFVASVFAGAASSVLDEREPREGDGVLPLSTLVSNLKFDANSPIEPASVASLLTDLREIQGVSLATAIYSGSELFGLGTIPLADAQALGIAGNVNTPYVQFEWSRALFEAEPIANYSPTAISSLANRIPVAILVDTDGETATIERARTLLITSPLTYQDAATRRDLADKETRKFVNSMATLAYIGIAITVFIAGISLSVATAAAILERKRIFGLLRLVGMPSNTIRNIVVIEAVVPLLAVVALSIGFGFTIAWLIIEGLSADRSMHWPDGRYVLTIVTSTLLAAGAVVATLGIVRANTTISQTRFE